MFFLTHISTFRNNEVKKYTIQRFFNINNIIVLSFI